MKIKRDTTIMNVRIIVINTNGEGGGRDYSGDTQGLLGCL